MKDLPQLKGRTDLEEIQKLAEDEWLYGAQCHTEEICGIFPHYALSWECSMDVNDLKLQILNLHEFKQFKQQIQHDHGIELKGKYKKQLEYGLLTYLRNLYTLPPDPEWFINCFLPTVCSTQDEQLES